MCIFGIQHDINQLIYVYFGEFPDGVVYPFITHNFQKNKKDLLIIHIFFNNKKLHL